MSAEQKYMKWVNTVCSSHLNGVDSSWAAISDKEARELWQKLTYSLLGVENHSISNIRPVLKNFTLPKAIEDLIQRSGSQALQGSESASQCSVKFICI